MDTILTITGIRYLATEFPLPFGLIFLFLIAWALESAVWSLTKIPSIIRRRKQKESTLAHDEPKLKE